SQQTDFGPVFGASQTPPGDLVSRNVPGQMPWPFDPGAFWVTDFGADPTARTDSTHALQAAVAAAHAFGSDEGFLPRGQYVLSSTVVLYPNTKFFGVPGGFSVLLAPHWNPNKVVSFMIQVGDASADPVGSKAGKAILSDLNFSVPTAGTTTITPSE